MGNDLNQLELRVLVEDDPNHPNLQILIDGEVILPPDQYKGFDPGYLLIENSPLLAQSVPHRVAIYLCSCGEPGCASIAPLITQEGDRIIWSDFRDFVGVYSRPTDEPHPDDSWGRPINQKGLTFSKADYERELQRAIDDRSWETKQRKICRLVKTQLENQLAKLQTLGVKLDWVFPAEEDVISLSFWRDADQLVVQYTAGGVSPELAADDIVESLLSKDVSDWPITWSSGKPWPQ